MRIWQILQRTALSSPFGPISRHRAPGASCTAISCTTHGAPGSGLPSAARYGVQDELQILVQCLLSVSILECDLSPMPGYLKVRLCVSIAAADAVGSGGETDAAAAGTAPSCCASVLVVSEAFMAGAVEVAASAVPLPAAGDAAERCFRRAKGPWVSSSWETAPTLPTPLACVTATGTGMLGPRAADDQFRVHCRSAVLTSTSLNCSKMCSQSRQIHTTYFGLVICAKANGQKRRKWKRMPECV